MAIAGTRIRGLTLWWTIGLLCWCAGADATPLGITLEDTAELAIRGPIERVRGHVLQQSESLQADPNRLYAEVEALLVPHFDMPYIAQIVLGRHWASATEAQRARFIETFKNHLIRNYSVTLLQYKDTTELRWQSKVREETDTVVRMEVVRSEAPPIQIDFSVHRVGEEWKIYDVSAQGISMATNFRGQFNAVIKREGVDALITRLEAHATQTQAAGSGTP